MSQSSISPVIEATRLTAYWSNKKMLVNCTSRIMLLKEATTLDAINVLKKFQNEHVLTWIKKSQYFKFSGDMGQSTLRWENMPEFSTDAYYYQGKLSAKFTFNNLIERLGNKCAAESEIIRAWTNSALGLGIESMRASQSRMLLTTHSTLLLPINSLYNHKFESLLFDLLEIHNTQNSNFWPDGYSGDDVSKIPKAFAAARDRLLSSSTGSALKRMAPTVYEALETTRSASQWLLWAKFQVACSQWLFLGALENLWLLPTNIASITHALSAVLPQVSTTRGWDVLAYKSKMTPSWLASLYACSTVREIDDTPENILQYIKYGLGGNYRTKIAEILNDHNTDIPFPLELLHGRTRNTTIYLKKFSLEWSKSLSPAWHSFFTLWSKAQPQMSEQSRSQIRPFIYWCQEQNLDNPWEITSTRLHNVHAPDDFTDFYHYLKNLLSNKSPDSSYAATSWCIASNVYSHVTNLAKLPNANQKHDLPDIIANPFSGISNPFPRGRQKNKTNRSRIQSELQEALIDELLCLETQTRAVHLPLIDDHGQPLLGDDGYPLISDTASMIEVMVPTFAWAKQWFEDNYPDQRRYQSPFWFQKNGAWVLNPSAAVCLAMLLLTPIRGKQARWLDQGLLDTYKYDTLTGRMIKNNHPLSQFRYSNGNDHETFYGSPSGVFQLQQDEMNGAMEPVIWSSTNKTAMWSGCKRTGFALPWPDGLVLMLNNDPEVKARGQYLARVYEVLRYQISFMESHDPNPSPLTFAHVAADRSLLPSDDDLIKNLPWFVPLCRQLGEEVNVTWPDGTTHRASIPISKTQIEKLYNALCVHVERKLQIKGSDYRNFLTQPAEHETLSIEGRRARYDIHSLRVAGISKLIEMGIPAHLVSEYIAGHQTVVMTLRYFQTTPMFLRKKLMEAMLQGDLIDGFESIAEQLKESGDFNGLLPAAERVRAHTEDLPLDFAALAPVPGGICLMGGRGSRCDECAVTVTTTKNGHEAILYTEQLGGCAGGRFYRTGPDFVLQQALEANKLMLLLRSKARERRSAITGLKELSAQIMTLELDLKRIPDDSATSKLEKQLQRLNLRHGSAKKLIAAQDETLAPLILQWYQRWKDYNDTQLLSTKLANSTANGLILIGDSEYIEFSPEIIESNDFGLARTVLEQSLCYVRNGQTLPEDSRLLVGNFLNRILSAEYPELLLSFNQFRTDNEQNWLTAAMASLLSSFFGDELTQSAAEGKARLHLNTELKINMKNLCEQPKTLLPDNNGNLIPIKILACGSGSKTSTPEDN